MESSTTLYQENKLLFFENWGHAELGLLNAKADEGENRKCLQNFTPKTEEKTDRVFSALRRFEHPILVRWPYLMNILEGSPASVEGAIRMAAYRFHGTDGLRGRTMVPASPISLREAIEAFVLRKQLTPELLQALVRNTIYAYESLMGETMGVVIGRDPRDLYRGDPQKELLFYKALQEGVHSTGQKTYDLDVVPVPCIPYLMAYWNDPHGPIQSRLVLYKTASHNPASQDGLKIFFRRSRQDGEEECVKPPVELEWAISALLMKEALEGPLKKKSSRTGEREKIEETAPLVLRQVMDDAENLSPLESVDFMVADLANGSFAWPPYREVAQDILKKKGVARLLWVGNSPNGRNINSNEGNDRVGAAHFENVFRISAEEIENGKFHGFPALHALLEYGKEHAGEIADGKMAWAIFTDGDGDRSYAAFYNPFSREIEVIDGDKAFFFHVVKAMANGKLRPGDRVAVTVESSVPFVNALFAYLQKFHPVQMMFSPRDPLPEHRIGLVIAPVGDKYILDQQCYGAESSGHCIKPYKVVGWDGKRVHERVFAGNGLISSWDTVCAMNGALQGEYREKLDLPEERKARTEKLARPYEPPRNEIVYIYFIAKSLWHRGSALWTQVEKEIEKVCHPHLLTPVVFEEEPDTLFLICFSSDGCFSFTVVARPSGTENKFSIKFMGTEQTRPFFSSVADRLFVEIAPRLKDPLLPEGQDELKLLRFIQNEEKGVKIDRLEQAMGIGDDPTRKACFMTIVEALSGKSQGLVSYNGETLRITERGKAFLQRNKG